MGNKKGRSPLSSSGTPTLVCNKGRRWRKRRLKRRQGSWSPRRATALFCAALLSSPGMMARREWVGADLGIPVGHPVVGHPVGAHPEGAHPVVCHLSVDGGLEARSAWIWPAGKTFLRWVWPRLLSPGWVKFGPARGKSASRSLSRLLRLRVMILESLGINRRKAPIKQEINRDAFWWACIFDCRKRINEGKNMIAVDRCCQLERIKRWINRYPLFRTGLAGGF